MGTLSVCVPSPPGSFIENYDMYVHYYYEYTLFNTKPPLDYITLSLNIIIVSINYYYYYYSYTNGTYSSGQSGIVYLGDHDLTP